MITYEEMWCDVPWACMQTSIDDVFGHEFERKVTMGFNNEESFRGLCNRAGLPNLEEHEAFQAALARRLLTR